MSDRLEAEIEFLRRVVRTANDRLAMLERRLSEHDQQIATLEDARLAHDMALAAFSAAILEVAEVRRELGQLRVDVADELGP